MRRISMHTCIRECKYRIIHWIEARLSVCQTMTRQRPRERSQSRLESRSFPPSTVSYMMKLGVSCPDSGLDEEQSFFERPPPPPPPLPPPPTSQQSQQTSQIDQAPGLVKDEEIGAKITDVLDTAQDREGITSEDLVG